MRSAIIIVFFMLFAGLAFGQAPEKRFVGNCSFSGFALVADSTYRGNITRFDDRLGDGYNLTQLAVGYEIFDGRGLVFTIDTIHSSTNFTADVSATAKLNRGFEPFGSGQVYYPTASGLIPPSSQEQSGLSPTQKARIDRHNVVTMETLVGGRDSVYRITNVPDTSSLAPATGDLFINATADTMGAYDGAGWQLFFGGVEKWLGTELPAGNVSINASSNNLAINSVNEFEVYSTAFNSFIWMRDSFLLLQSDNIDNVRSRIEINSPTQNTSGISFLSGSNPSFGVYIDSIGIGFSDQASSYNSATIMYRLANDTPSTTLNDTTVMAWRGTGSAAEAVGFVPYGGGGSSSVDHDTSAYFHRRLTFGTDYTLPSAVLDTADLISIYAGAQTGTSITITLPTLSDTTYDGKIIYVMGSGTENGDIMRITSPDSTDILVQGCGAGSVTGPDTITTSYRVLYQYIISNRRYYRTCQRANVNSITSVPDTTSIDAHQGDMFVNSTADTLGLYSGSGWVLFYGGGNVAIDTFYTYSAFRAANSTADAVVITAPLLSGVFVRSDIDRVDDGGIYIQDASGTDWQRIGVREVDTRWYGAVGDATTDCTAEIQAALDYARDNGGGTVVLPPGTVYVSNDSSAHPNAMLLIHSGTHLKGWGRNETTLTRASGNRGNNGIFIVTAGYDTATVYNAAGNIVISDFTMTDGAITPNRSFGNLIALAHCENAIVERMGFGNHDQHAVDIHASKNITVRDCVADNDVVATASCATFQVEGSRTNGVWGVNVDGTGTSDIYIYNNIVDNAGASNTFHIFHGASTPEQVFSNIKIYDNYVSGAYAADQDVIGTDDEMYTTATGLQIRNNTIVGNHITARGINFFDQNTNANCSDVIIEGNRIQGSLRAGIFFGGNQDGAMDFDGLRIINNVLDVNFGATSGVRYGINVWGGKETLILGNFVEMSGDTMPYNSAGAIASTSLYTITSAEKVIFSNNIAKHNFTYGKTNTGVVTISDYDGVGMDIIGVGNILPVASYTSGVTFPEEVYKSATVSINSSVNINEPLIVEGVTVAADNDINLNKTGSGIFTLDFSSYSGIATDLDFYNPQNGGEYEMWITGCSSDTISFPNNFLTYTGDSLKTRLCASNERIEFMYDGTNYVTTDTFWAEVTAAPVGGGDSLLNTYPGAVMALSLRIVDNTYTGDCILVRRSSDDATQAIGYSGGVIDTASLKTFVGANDGYVVRWYSTTGDSAVQTTTTLQPRIVISGSVVYKGGKVAVDFDGADDYLTVAGNIFSGASSGSTFSVHNHDNATAEVAGRDFVYGSQDTVGARYDFGVSRSANTTTDEQFVFYVEGAFHVSTTEFGTTNQYLITGIYSNTNGCDFWVNNTQYVNDATTHGTLSSGTDFVIGADIALTHYHDGKVQEIIIYDSDQTSNRVAIQSNLNTYYSVY